MKTAVVGLSPYLDKDLYLAQGLDVFQDPYAFMREGLMRCFTPNLSNIAVLTCLLELGYEAEQVDTTLEFGLPFTSESRQAWISRVKSFFATNHFDNIFISCVSASEHLNLRLVTDAIRQVNPDCIVGVGSYHANTLRGQLLAEMPAIDFIFLGDLERSASTLMSTLESRDMDKLSRMENVIVQKMHGTSEVADKKPQRRSSESSFSYRLCNKYLAYYDSMASVAMKGCPYTCAFCQEKIVRPGHFRRTPDVVISETIDNYAYYKERFGHVQVGYGFMDPIFGMSKPWNQGFVEAIKTSGFRFNWGAQTHVGQLDADTLKSMAAAGCRILYYGLENFSPTMLAKMDKTQKPENYLSDFYADINNCTTAGILVEANILFGFPGETNETLRTNEEGIKDLLTRYPNTSINLNIFRPLPGTIGLDKSMTADGARLLIDEWWSKPIVPGLTVTVKPSPEVDGARLIDFFNSIYNKADTYNRRGVNDILVSMFNQGELTCDNLKHISQMIRAKLWQMAEQA